MVNLEELGDLGVNHCFRLRIIHLFQIRAMTTTLRLL
jgi:hypothetical protein